MWDMVVASLTLTVGAVGVLSSGLAILLGAGVGTGIALLFVGLQRIIDGQTTRMSSRLDQFAVAPAGMAPAKQRRQRRQRRRPAYVDGANSASFTSTLARDLARADLKVTVGEFLVLTVVLASLGALVGVAIPVGGRILLGAVLGAAGFFGPRFYVTRRKNARQQAFNNQLSDVITLMSGALRSGYSLLQSMELVAREGPVPVSMEFDRVVREVGLGLSPEEALANLVERMQSEDLELLVTAINVQREVGGNLVEVMDTISTTIRERVKLVGEVKVLTAQQAYSGYIIALLPVALSLLLGVINPSYMLGIFQTTHWCGWTMVGCSGIMILSGFLVIRRIVDIKV
jgi:tight adherence protein B